MPSVVSAPKQQMAHGNYLAKIYEFKSVRFIFNRHLGKHLYQIRQIQGQSQRKLEEIKAF